MNEQTGTGARRSKFSGALFRVSDQGNIIRSFALQYLIYYAADMIVQLFFRVVASSYPVGDFFPFLFSAHHVAFNFVSLLVIWGVVWIIKCVSPNFYARLFPVGFVSGHREEDVASQIIQEAFDKEIAYTDAQARISNKLRAIAAIDGRISRLRVRTNLLLYSTGLLLVGASLIIIFAGTLTNLDASAVSNVDKISKDIIDIERRLSRLSQVEDLKKASLTDVNAAKKLSNLADIDSTLPISDDGIQSAIAAEKENLKQSEDLLKTAWNKELTSEHGYNDTRYIVATAITRIGVVLVIIFLAQILIGLYRYNTRLITFYHSRRDLFQIWDGKGANMDKLQKLTAPNIDFGKEPKHPLDDVIRQVLAKVHFTGVPVGESSEPAPKKGS